MFHNIRVPTDDGPGASLMINAFLYDESMPIIIEWYTLRIKVVTNLFIILYYNTKKNYYIIVKIIE